MGQPHEDLETLRVMKGRLEETKEMAKTLGSSNGGEVVSVYQALVQVGIMVDKEIESVRNVVGPHNDQ